jgi:hypothetical protein
MRIILAALAVAAIGSLALAQSGTGTPSIQQPTNTAPASDTSPIAEPTSKIAPAANSQTRGIRVGKDAMDAGPLKIKRNK